MANTQNTTQFNFSALESKVAETNKVVAQTKQENGAAAREAFAEKIGKTIFALAMYSGQQGMATYAAYDMTNGENVVSTKDIAIPGAATAELLIAASAIKAACKSAAENIVIYANSDIANRLSSIRSRALSTEPKDVLTPGEIQFADDHEVYTGPVENYVKAATAVYNAVQLAQEGGKKVRFVGIDRIFSYEIAGNLPTKLAEGNPLVTFNPHRDSEGNMSIRGRIGNYTLILQGYARSGQYRLGVNRGKLVALRQVDQKNEKAVAWQKGNDPEGYVMAQLFQLARNDQYAKAQEKRAAAQAETVEAEEAA